MVTEHDSVYALDADTYVPTPYWTNSFINPPNTNTIQTSTDIPNNNIKPEIGITCTPVIDPVAGTIYVEARTRELSGGVTNYVHRLHALDIATGLERSNSPVVIAPPTILGSAVPMARSTARPFSTVTGGPRIVEPAARSRTGPAWRW